MEDKMTKELEISIFTGHFGSGKTEFALNHSINISKNGKKVLLVDLDIVNPFFRSSEAKGILQSYNIELISPNYATTNVDVPSLPAAIYGAFQRSNTHVVFDVGGDEDGAIALGRYYPYFKDISYKMYFLINTCRPFTKRTEDIVDLAKKIEHNSRLKITDIINNTNLSYETSMDIVINSQDIVKDVANKLNIPVTYIGIFEDLIDSVPDNLKNLAYPIKRYMKPLWEI